MTQQILRTLKVTLSILSLWVLSLPLGAQEMIFMENSFDPSVDHAQLLPEDQKGTVSWTAETRTLLLKDVQINTPAKVLEGWMPDEITILVEGTNQIVVTGADDGIVMRSSACITGSGTISITAQGGYAYSCFNGANLTIVNGVAVTTIGLYGGIVGDFISSRLLINKAYVTASTLEGRGMASIGYFNNITLKDCAISSPAKAKIANINDAYSISVDGEKVYTGEVIIAPEQVYYQVTIAEVEHGRVVAPEGVDLTHLLGGTSVTFTAEPEEGYALTKLMAGTEDITNTRTLVVKDNVTVTPTFTPVKSYRVTLQKPEHGTLSVRETEYDLSKVLEGSILHFVCTPDEGYELEKVMAGDQDITQSLYIQVMSDIEITAQYKKIPVPTHQVTIAILGYGEVTADYPDLTAVPEGTTIHLTCTPKDEHHYLAYLQANGEDIMAHKSFTVYGADVRVSATFKEHRSIEDPQQPMTPTISLSRGKLTISAISSNQVVSLVTLLGEPIYHTNMTTGTPLTISLEGIPTGVYILSIGDSSYKLNI